jgi:hypothetical protein
MRLTGSANVCSGQPGVSCLARTLLRLTRSAQSFRGRCEVMPNQMVITEWRFRRNPCIFRRIRMEWNLITGRSGHCRGQRGCGRPGTLMGRCERTWHAFLWGCEEIPDRSMSEMRADTSTIGEKVAGAGSSQRSSLIMRHQRAGRLATRPAVSSSGHTLSDAV